MLWAQSAQSTPSHFDAQHPLELSVALEMARAQSPKLRADAQAREAARARTQAARARFFPRAEVVARYTRLSEVEPGKIQLPLPQLPGQQPPGPAQLGEMITDQLSARVQIEQPLFTGFALTRGVELAERVQHAVQAAEAISAADLDLQVEEALLGAAQAAGIVEVLAQSVRALRTRLADVQALRAVGRLAELDVLQVQAKIAQVEASLAQADAQAQAARGALAILLGLPEGAVQAVAAPELPSGALSVSAQAQVGEEARSLEAQAQSAQAALKTQQADLQKSKYYPQVLLRAGATLGNPNERHFPPKNEWNATWDASLVVAWQFDSLVSHHEAKALRAEATQAQQLAQGADRAAAAASLRARAAYEGALARAEALESHRALQAHALRDAQTLFEAHRLTAAALLEYQIALDQAALDQLNAQFEARFAQARWRRHQRGHETP